MWDGKKVEDLLDSIKLMRYTVDIKQSPLQAQIEMLYYDMLEDRVQNDALYTALHIFGEAGFSKAEKIVARYLDHPDDQLRAIATHVIGHHWKSSKYTPKLKELMLNDNENEVRFRAASGLGSIYQSTKNAEILAFLIDALRNHSEDFDVRATIYEAILEIWGISSVEAFDRSYWLKSESEFDWSLINEIEKKIKK
jgi:HEAT repeat protein